MFSISLVNYPGPWWLNSQLLAAGVDVDLGIYPTSPHGFTDIDKWLTNRLGRIAITNVPAG